MTEQTIHKYMLMPLPGVQHTTCPRGARVIKVMEQHNHLALWMEVYPDRPEELRQFLVAFTGAPLIDVPKTYLDSVQIGEFVFHIYELLTG
jgi:hypothetical protein